MITCEHNSKVVQVRMMQKKLGAWPSQHVTLTVPNKKTLGRTSQILSTHVRASSEDVILCLASSNIFLSDGNQLAHRVKCSALCAHFFNITWLRLLLLFYVFHNQKRRKESIFSLSTPTLEYKIFPVCASCTLATSHQPAASQNTDKTELHNSDAPSCVLVAMDLTFEGKVYITSSQTSNAWVLGIKKQIQTGWWDPWENFGHGRS